MFRPQVPHCTHNFQRQPDAILKRTPIPIRTCVSYKRKKFMKKISVRGMNFDYAKSGFERAFSGLYERIYNSLNTIHTKRFRQYVIIGKRYGAGSNHRPPPTVLFNAGSFTHIPWPEYRSFSASMRQLNSRYSPLRFNKFSNPLQIRDMLIFPKPQILRSDAAACFYGGRLNHNYTCPAHGAASQVN